jgi:hypothetical protein
VRKRTIIGSSVVIAVTALSGVATLLTRPAASPPSVSTVLLEYTNRTGRPYALLAITNHSAGAISVKPTCLVLYSTKPASAGSQVTSIEANTVRVTRLQPNAGFVQDVFVFPDSKGQWQFECYAAYSSKWLETKLLVENRLRKTSPSISHLLTTKAWQKFNSSWYDCPR